MTRPVSWIVTLLALVSVTTLSSCSEDKEKGKGSQTAKVTAATSGDCASCERQNVQLSNRLKAAQNQIRKLKKQLKAKRSKKKLSAQKPASK